MKVFLCKWHNLIHLLFYQGSLWHAVDIPEFGVSPQSIFLDKEDDGERNNPWRPAYLWMGGEQLIIKPSKLFVDGDSWFSDMSKLGENVGVPDTLCLDSIKVVPNPYKLIRIGNYFNGIKT